MRFPLLLCLALSAAFGSGARAATPILLRAQTLPMGAPTRLELSVVPAGRDLDEMKMVAMEPKSGPIARSEISTRGFLLPSPFALTISQRQNGVWKRVNVARFTQTKDVVEIIPRWLDAKAKRGPVLLLHFGFTHWHEWEVLTFPNGFGGRVCHQTFGFGGEGQSYVFQDFSGRDARGLLQVSEEESDANGAISRRVYRWSGHEFLDASRPYLVIAGSYDTREAAEKSQQPGDVVFSSWYSKLAPGYFIVVNGRFASAREAQKWVAELRKNKVKAYWKRAF